MKCCWLVEDRKKKKTLYGKPVRNCKNKPGHFNRYIPGYCFCSHHFRAFAPKYKKDFIESLKGAE